MADTILKVDNINVYYGNIHAVKGVSFEVNEGEIVTLIAGEVEVKRPVDADWVKFAAPQEFEIQANCEYDIRTYGVAEYLCDYYKD